MSEQKELNEALPETDVNSRPLGENKFPEGDTEEKKEPSPEPQEPHIATMAKLDSRELLAMLREIEVSLTQFDSQQGEMPVWAQSLVPRIANLERIMSRYSSSLTAKAGARATDEPSKGLHNMDHAEIEQRILQTVQKEANAEVGTMQYLFKGKIESAVREMERLQLLLKTRPSTRDVHKITDIVADLATDIRRQMSQTTEKVDALVSGTVASEMDGMLGRIGQSEKSLDASFNIATKKVANFHASIEEFEGGISETKKVMNTRLDKMQKSSDDVEEMLQKYTEDQTAERIRLERALEDVNGAMNAAAEVFADYRSKSATRISALENMVSKSDNAQKKHADETEDRDMELNSNLKTLENALSDFRKVYEDDTNKANDFMANLQHQLEELQAVQKTHIDYLDECHEVGIIEKALAHDDVINILKKKSKNHHDDLDGLQKKVISVNAMVESIQDEMSKFPEAVKRTEGELDRVVLEIEKAGTNVSTLEETFKDTQNQVNELYAIRQEIRDAQNEGEEQGMRVKAVFDQLSSILSKSEEHDKTIEDVFLNLEEGESNIQKTMEDLRFTLMETLMAKQAEIEAQVENVKENMEMVMLTHSPMGGMMSGGGAKKPQAQQAALPPAQQRQQQRAGSTVRRGQSKLRGKAGGDPGVLQQMVQEQDSRNALIHGTLPPPQGTAHLTNAALRQEFNFNAQFVADLCVSFEEISVRKGKVDLVPPAICENMAGAAQGMAQLICTVVDSEIMQGVLQGLEDETRLESDVVTGRRRDKMDTFLNDIIAHVTLQNPNPGSVRMEGRETFMGRFNKVLDVCMSKHDQMMVVGNSRLGRTKIPSCIACDRPMVDKVRHGQESVLLDAHPLNEASMASFGAGVSASMVDGFDVKIPMPNKSGQ